jgi:predicted small lipoprotein YifL
VRALLLALLPLLLAACGVKGPLELPDGQRASPPTPPAAPLEATPQQPDGIPGVQDEFDDEPPP